MVVWIVPIDCGLFPHATLDRPIPNDCGPYKILRGTVEYDCGLCHTTADCGKRHATSSLGRCLNQSSFSDRSLLTQSRVYRCRNSSRPILSQHPRDLGER